MATHSLKGTFDKSVSENQWWRHCDVISNQSRHNCDVISKNSSAFSCVWVIFTHTYWCTKFQVDWRSDKGITGGGTKHPRAENDEKSPCRIGLNLNFRTNKIKPWYNPNIIQFVSKFCFPIFQALASISLIGAPNELFCKKALLQWAFCWETWSSLCVAGKMNYICWETFLENLLLNGYYRRKGAKFFLERWSIFENLLKLWMFVMKRT